MLYADITYLRNKQILLAKQNFCGLDVWDKFRIDLFIPERNKHNLSIFVGLVKSFNLALTVSVFLFFKTN